MEIQHTEKPILLSSCLVSLIMILDGISMAFFGFIYLVGSANSDFFSDPGKKEVVLHQGEIVALLTLVYLVFCIVSLVYWQKGKRAWNYFVLGLGLFHLAGAIYLMISPDWKSDLARLYFYSSLTLNLLLLTILVFGRKKLRLFTENRNT